MNSSDSAIEMARECQRIFHRLKVRAIQHGDLMAALTLVDVAVAATKAAHSLWFEKPIHNPFQRTPDEIAARRAALWFFVGPTRDFPILHSWRNKPAPEQAEILRAMEFGPMKGRGRMANATGTFINEMILPVFMEIRSMTQQPEEIADRKIWRLPPLTPKSAGAWASEAVAWLWRHPRARALLCSPESSLNAIANPERELARDRRKAEARLERQIAKWKRECGWPLDPLRATRRLRAMKRIRSMKVTPAHLRAGLRAALLAYWERNLDLSGTGG